ncbi:MAG: lytic transglycosylase domain-containing protein [Sciscionella sp.]
MASNPASQQHDDDADPALPRRGLGLVARLAVAGVVVGLASGAVWFVSRASRPEPGLTAKDIPALQVAAADVAPGSVAPAEAMSVGKLAKAKKHKPKPQGGATRNDPLGGWAAALSRATDIPARVLWAYGNAELSMRASFPGCHISWATLAGIGRVESDHGRFAGTTVNPDGTLSRPIIGVPLNGSGAVATVSDTDGGALDGDRMHDRAVGPMQFIPSTWRTQAADGNGDGKADPEQVDDAALAAAHYLCVSGRDMATAQGWWSGIFSYNRSVEYGKKVFGLADEYARQARQTLPGVGQ